MIREMQRAVVLAWRRYPVATTIAVLLTPVLAISTAASAVIQRSLVNSASGATPAGVVIIAVLAGLVLTAWLVLGGLQQNLFDMVSLRLAPEFRTQALGLIDARARFEDLGDPTYQDDIERIRRDPMAPHMLPRLLLTALVAIVSLILSVLLLLSVDWRLVVVVVGAATSLAISLLLSRREVREEEELTVLERGERQLHRLCVDPRGVEEIRSYAAGGLLSAEASRAWERIASRRLRSQLRAQAWRGASWILLGVGLVWGFQILAVGIADGQHTIGDLALLIILTSSLRGQLSTAFSQFTTIAAQASSVAAFARLRKRSIQRADEGPALGDTQRDTLTTGISLRGVGFTYARAQRPTLVDLTLDLPAGSLVAVVGENGAGKSTFSNLLLGLLTPTEGSFTVDGAAVDASAWRRRTSGAFQDFMKPRLRVREAIGLGDTALIENSEVILSALTSAGGDRLHADLPDGIETSLAKGNGADLSHGQWQTIALARSAMRANPLLMILDEPTSALDAHAEYELFQWFARQARESARDRGTISLMVSHRYSAAYLADRILVIDAGRIIEHGTHAELMQTQGRYRTMFELQRDAYLGPSPA